MIFKLLDNNATNLFNDPINNKIYFDSRANLSLEEYLKKLEESSTVYVGNLAFYTTEEQILQYFSAAGCIKTLVMGLNKHKKTPCGFCFVEFHSREAALQAIDSLQGTQLDGKAISVDMDIGMSNGRQFGRGFSGYQRKDENNYFNNHKQVDDDRQLDTALISDKGYRSKNRNEHADYITDENLKNYKMLEITTELELAKVLKEYRVDCDAAAMTKLFKDIDTNYTQLYNIEGKLTMVERFISLKPMEYHTRRTLLVKEFNEDKFHYRVYEHKINQYDNMQNEAREALRVLFTKSEFWADFFKDVKYNVFSYKDPASRKWHSDTFKSMEYLRIKYFYKVEVQAKDFDFQKCKEFDLDVTHASETKSLKFEWVAEKTSYEREKDQNRSQNQYGREHRFGGNRERNSQSDAKTIEKSGASQDKDSDIKRKRND